MKAFRIVRRLVDVNDDRRAFLSDEYEEQSDQHHWYADSCADDREAEEKPHDYENAAKDH
jgi:hypothetical protein